MKLKRLERVLGKMDTMGLEQMVVTDAISNIVSDRHMGGFR